MVCQFGHCHLAIIIGGTAKNPTLEGTVKYASRASRKLPVASVLLRRRLVSAVEAIYSCARSASDIADQGEARRLRSGPKCLRPLCARLAGVVPELGLTADPMYDLLSAFRQNRDAARGRPARPDTDQNEVEPKTHSFEAEHVRLEGESHSLPERLACCSMRQPPQQDYQRSTFPALHLF